jgi:hypothetical protein
MHLVRFLPSFLRCSRAIAIRLFWFPSNRDEGRARKKNMQGKRENEGTGECPRRMKGILPGRPQGVITSRGTCTAYQPNRRTCKRKSRHKGRRQKAAFGTAKVSSQGMRAEISSTEVQPTLLPAPRMPEGGESLAGCQAATETPGRSCGPPAACRGRTPTAEREGIPGQGSGRGPSFHERCGLRAPRVVTRQEASRKFL